MIADFSDDTGSTVIIDWEFTMSSEEREFTEIAELTEILSEGDVEDRKGSIEHDVTAGFGRCRVPTCACFRFERTATPNLCGDCGPSFEWHA